MNFLQLVQMTHSLLRATGNQLGVSPDTVAGQESLPGELVVFVNQAWQDIQNESEQWRFMWGEGSLTLPQGSDTITPTAIPDFDSYWLAESDGRGRFATLFRESIADEITVRFVPYAAWQQSYLERGERSPGQPGNFTILPDTRMRFDMEADAAYTVRINYRKTNQNLVDNSDTPNMPSRHHMAIVWWAICRYYCTTREGANSLRDKSATEMRREMQKLKNEQIIDPIILECGR